MKILKSILILILFTNISWGQTVDLSSPRGAFFTHLENLKPNNYHPEISGKVMYGVAEEQASDKAVKLKYIYDGKGVFIDYNNIPTEANYTDSLHFPLPKHAFKPFPFRLPKIYLEKYGNKWYYSKETVAYIDNLYQQIYPLGADLLVKYVPASLKYKFFGLQTWQWIGLILLIIFTYFLHIIFKRILFLLLKLFKKIVTNISIENIDDKLKQFSHPLSYIFGIYVMEVLFPYLIIEHKFSIFIINSLAFAKIIFWIFVFIKLIDVFIAFYKNKAKQTESLLDDQLLPILEKTLKVIVIIFGIFKMLMLMGADPKAIIAGASIGGLAIGLAAQDTVRNLIGSFMIFVDKPFKIGDWIKVGNIEGSVEEVGFRSTIIRAADTSVFKIPNSTLSEDSVNNLGKRIYRRYTTTLGIRYDTPPELIEEFVEGIKKLIELHPTTRNFSNYTPYNSVPYNVEFIDYGDSSLNILLNVYFMTHDYGEEMHGRHILLLGILDLANTLGVEFAFPSQTLFMELFPDKTPAYPKYETNPDEIKKRLEQVINDFKTKISKY